MTLDQTLRQFLDRFTMPDLKGLDWQVTADRLRPMQTCRWPASAQPA